MDESPRTAQSGVRAKLRQKLCRTVRAGKIVKRGQSKISFSTSRFGAMVFLNFDLTPFAYVTPFAYNHRLLLYLLARHRCATIIFYAKPRNSELHF